MSIIGIVGQPSNVKHFNVVAHDWNGFVGAVKLKNKFFLFRS